MVNKEFNTHLPSDFIFRICYMNTKRNSALQTLCRQYLSMLRGVAKKHGLADFVDETIKANADNKCAATATEVELLSRAVDDERLTRLDVPRVLSKSYRKAYDDGDLDNPKLKKLRRVGIYSKVSALLLKAENENED